MSHFVCVYVFTLPFFSPPTALLLSPAPSSLLFSSTPVSATTSSFPLAAHPLLLLLPAILSAKTRVPIGQATARQAGKKRRRARSARRRLFRSRSGSDGVVKCYRATEEEGLTKPREVEKAAGSFIQLAKGKPGMVRTGSSLATSPRCTCASTMARTPGEMWSRISS